MIKLFVLMLTKPTSLVLVGGLEVSQSPSQSKPNLETVFRERFPDAHVILFDGVQSTKKSAKHQDQILFLAQNVGGLVLKQALLEATRDWKYQNLVLRTVSLGLAETIPPLNSEFLSLSAMFSVVNVLESPPEEEEGRAASRNDRQVFDAFVSALRVPSLAERDPWMSFDGRGGLHSTTGWITAKSAYIEWLAYPKNCLLHIRGKPGSGSSTVAAHVTGQVMTIPEYSNATFISFSCHTQYAQTRDTASILLSLCRQLLSTKPALYRRAQPLCSALLEQSLFNHQAGMWALFRSLLEFHTTNLFCFIDGIHNCEGLIGYLEAIASMKRGALGTLKCILSGSSEVKTAFSCGRDALYTVDLNEQQETKTLKKAAVKQRVLRNARRSMLWLEFQDPVINHINEEASTSYLLAMSKLELLEAHVQYSTEKHLISTLADLPKTLDDLYSHYIEHLGLWELQVLECIVAAIRPFRSFELAICLALQGGIRRPDVGRNLRRQASPRKPSSSNTLPCIGTDHYNLCYDRSQAHKAVLDLFEDALLRRTWSLLYAHFKNQQPGSLESSIRSFSMASRLGLTELVGDLVTEAIAKANLKQGEDTLSSPPAAVAADGYQLVEECLSFAASEGRAELIDQLSGAGALSQSILAFTNQDGFTPLLRAVRGGHLQTVDVLLRHGASLEATTRDGSNALHTATQLGDNAMVQKILGLEGRPQVATINTHGYDAVKIAAESGFYGILELLLAEVDKKVIDKPLPSSNRTPIFLAAVHGHAESVELLLRHGADPMIHDDNESSALYHAAKEGDVVVFSLLLASSAYQSVRVKKNIGGAATGEEATREDARHQGFALHDLQACLLVAAEHRQLPIIESLLDYEINMDSPGEGKNTALHLAARMGFADVAEMLLKRGCQVDLRNAKSMAPVQLAAQHGNLEVVKILVEKKANIDSGSDPEPPFAIEPTLSALELAAKGGYVQVVQYLVESDHKPAPKALGLAAESGRSAVIKVLMSHKSMVGDDEESIEPANQKAILEAARAALMGQYPKVLDELLPPKIAQRLLEDVPNDMYELLYLAISNGDGDAIQILAEKGYDMNRKDGSGSHPLHLAVDHKKADVIEPLAKNGATVDTCNDNNETPLYSASKSHMKDAVEKLLEMKADPNICSQPDRSAALHAACQTLGRNQNEDALKVISCLLEHDASPALKDRKGWTPLHHAAKNLDACRLIIGSHGERSSLLAERSNGGSTPLMRAAQNGSVEVMKLFLEHGADPTNLNKFGSSALHWAARGRHRDAVKLLIDNKHRVVSPSIRDSSGPTVLHGAVFGGNQEIIEYLVSLQGVDINAQVERLGTPLCLAAALYARASKVEEKPKEPDTGDKWLRVCKTLLDLKADVNSAGGADCSPFHHAAQGGKQDLATLLLEHQANINIFSKKFGTPLSSAIESEEYGFIKYLLERGADPNISIKGKVALQLAVETGDWRTVCSVLENTKVSLEGGKEALWAAIRKDMVEAVEALVEHKTTTLRNIAAADRHDDGRTPLMYAVKWDSSKVVDYLLRNAKEYGIDIDERNNAGECAIHIAARQDTPDMMARLLEHGANPNTPNSAGRTTSMLSAKQGNSDMLGLLLDKGADVFQKDMHNRDTLDWACVSGSMDVLSRVVAKVKGMGEWKTRFSAVLHRVLTTEEPTNLLEVLFEGCDGNEREEIVSQATADRNNWTLAYLVKHTLPPLELPDWVTAGIRKSRLSSSFDAPMRPSAWDILEKRYPLNVSDDGLTVEVGPGPIAEDEQQRYNIALIRSDYCIPADKDYEFEITITAPDEAQKAGSAAILGVGLCTENAWEDRMVGWDTGSLGYHGDDGRKYTQAEWGRLYTESYGAGDKIGCKIEVQPGGDRTVSFTKNTKPLGIAFDSDDLPRGQLYPAISIDCSLTGYTLTATFPDIDDPETRRAVNDPLRFPGKEAEEEPEDGGLDSDIDSIYSW
ncbi:ankyrin repeat-containing domain protein [Bombardia bombarda]|uniref:Ankyrin repeat-containing domain protein n=1 Tax=Bombardia bombarda TaxID=252184 RepID=A0AA40C5F0_9PEZI|nr:ankyrin repeat-containing domain protein [Bombardia bombarda]